MKRILVDPLPSRDRPVAVSEDEAHHLLQVLRARNHEKIEALDGRGSKMWVELHLLGKGQAEVRALGEPIQDPQLLSLPITLEMSVLKGDAMEWVVEKSVELGVRSFVPVLTAHAVLQVDRKGPEFYQERWQKIADQALKQCGRLDRMIVERPLDLSERMQTQVPLRIWADEASRASSPSIGDALRNFGSESRSRGVTLLIGPEGGWSTHERELLARAGARSTSLGPWVYRAETAALFATSLLAASMR